MRRRFGVQRLVRQALVKNASTSWVGGVIAVLGCGFLLLRFVASPYVDDAMNPVATGGPYEVTTAAAALHDGLFVVDMHSDALLWERDLRVRHNRGHVDLPRLRDGNVALQVFSVVTKSPWGQGYESNSADTDRITLLAVAQGWGPRTWGSLEERALFQAERLARIERQNPDELIVIRTRDDLVNVVTARLNRSRRLHGTPRRGGNDVTGALLAMEGLHALEGHPDRIDTLYAAGFRMMALTHMFDNEFAGAAHGVSQAGLSPAGAEAIRRMEDRGIVLDLAHASALTIDDALVISTRPVVVSHTGLQGTCPGSRNLSDRQIRSVAATGGVIGVGFWPGAVCAPTVEAIVDAIDYGVALVGAAHIGLGSDFDGTVETATDASGVALITQELLKRGYVREDIAQIMGDNVRRVLMEVLPSDLQHNE